MLHLANFIGIQTFDTNAHDWYRILSMFNKLDYAQEYGTVVFTIGATCVIASLLLFVGNVLLDVIRIIGKFLEVKSGTKAPMDKENKIPYTLDIESYMKCPVCKTSDLVLQNNNYFCPSCKIYVGPNTEDFTAKLKESATAIVTSQPSQNVQFKIPTGIIIIASLYLLSGALILLSIAYGAILFFVLGKSAFFITAIFNIINVAISLPLAVLNFLLFYGFMRLRRWAFNLFMVLYGIVLLAFLYTAIRGNINIDVKTVVGFIIYSAITYYVWSKSSLFLSKKEAENHGIVFKGLPLVAKIIIIAILIVYVALLAYNTIIVKSIFR